jgi:hypothetical protein
MSDTPGKARELPLDFWMAQRFTAVITGLFSAPALQFAEKRKFPIRASLERCRKFFEFRCPLEAGTESPVFQQSV